MSDIHQYKILILDFGSQYTQLIARRVREIGVYCELHSCDLGEDAIKAFAPNGIILSGGPQSAHAADGMKAPEVVFSLGCPVLGICYGMQTMAMQLGGAVQAGEKAEFGHTELNLSTKTSRLFQEIPTSSSVWMSHGDKVTALPAGFELTASSDNTEFAAMENPKQHFYGVQFHPEVTHTEHGLQLLKNFVLDICACEALWTPAHIIENALQELQDLVGNEHVLLGLSGGVDSSVVAALLHKAIVDQLTCVFVDTGLLRLNEGDQVMATFAEHMGVNVIRVDAHDRFFAALKGICDPEQKRKIVGRLFIEVFDEIAHKLENVKWLAQGTIYPDVIESAGSHTGKAQVIKSHHNVGGLPEKMNLKLLEPLRELFKDEVRQVGLALGLPKSMVYRHPFPGPGLTVRILGEVKEDYANLLRQADAIWIEELVNNGYYDKVAQAFAVFLPVKSVGVVGDQRCYEWVIALRAVETTDFMTAHWAHLPYDLISHASHRIVNEIKGISRVVYDVTGKPPATIEWE